MPAEGIPTKPEPGPEGKVPRWGARLSDEVHVQGRLGSGEGEVRGLLACAGGGRLLTGGGCSGAVCWAGSQGGSVSVSVFFVLPPNFGILLNRLARRFFVVGDSWFVAFLISCSGVAVASSSSLRPLVM